MLKFVLVRILGRNGIDVGNELVCLMVWWICGESLVSRVVIEGLVYDEEV